MKNYIKTLFVLTSIIFSACEDVIDVDVDTAETRLVIEASLDWEKGTTGNNQTIKLSLSSPYFNTQDITVVTGANVVVTNMNTGDIFNFTDENDGSYTTNSFEPIIGNTYSLQVSYNGETYEATETLMAVPEIKEINQSIEGGFDDELLEVNVYFDDPVDEENYYLLNFYETGDLFSFFADVSDEFVNGNEVYYFFEKEDDEDNNQAPFQAGDTVDIELYGISESYYNYMRLLIEQYYSGGNPFSSTAALIKGNCINPTNPDNYAFGYFRVTEVDVATYTFE
ncbi:hypothetical protein PK35_04975 [Tamlana nanhaiensis]|uniref:DUF4249 domain-containing protein n=1 Tax=Neotamlana nanhaiensis TaxID=1382798 RepID=A0A0D7W4M0_9FLAO|nr:DUF4249 domain-containing protein [Tamlana nanhaiensis]KJD34085.1 hypothetical protein PK35_04975 [Tamlana nanhaiensis]